MTYKLKDFYDESRIRSIAGDVGRVHQSFDVSSFVEKCVSGLSQLELTERAAHIAEVLHEHLPSNYRRAALVLVESLGPALERSGEFGMAPFHYLPHVLFVARYGLDDFEISMHAQYELTKRFSAESSRKWIVRHALRSLVKRGDRGALAILGYASKPAIVIERLRLTPSRVKLGSVLRFSFELSSKARREQELLVDINRVSFPLRDFSVHR